VCVCVCVVEQDIDRQMDWGDRYTGSSTKLNKHIVGLQVATRNCAHGCGHHVWADRCWVAEAFGEVGVDDEQYGLSST
jgi:hypothetical protein